MSCKIGWCTSPARAKGWCSKHYQSWLKYGDPLTARTKTANGEPRRYFDRAMRNETDECIAWPYKTNGHGYGQMFVDGAHQYVHRLACEHQHGTPPNGMEAAHACGNRSCINPRHIRWATKKENSADKIEHGRMNYGSRHGNSKLTERDVRLIRSLFGKMKHEDIAHRFGVGRKCIQKIHTGVTWGWLS